MPEITRNLSFPRLCGLLAQDPTRLSQAMHNAGFLALGLDYSYVAFDTVDTKAAIEAMRALGIRGYSLTIPHKQLAMPLVDVRTPEVDRIGALNTIINDGQKLTGHNTDWTGILLALKEANFSLSSKRVLILGAGGAAQAMIFAAEREGAKSITIANRTFERGQALQKRFSVEALEFASLSPTVVNSFDLLVNTTPLGSKLITRPEYPFELKQLSASITVFDSVTADTPLLQAAKLAGSKTIAGSRMLLFQGLEQFRLFTDREPPRDAMEAALRVELAK